MKTEIVNKSDFKIAITSATFTMSGDKVVITFD